MNESRSARIAASTLTLDIALMFPPHVPLTSCLTRTKRWAMSPSTGPGSELAWRLPSIRMSTSEPSVIDFGYVPWTIRIAQFCSFGRS